MSIELVQCSKCEVEYPATAVACLGCGAPNSRVSALFRTLRAWAGEHVFFAVSGNAVKIGRRDLPGEPHVTMQLSRAAGSVNIHRTGPGLSRWKDREICDVPLEAFAWVAAEAKRHLAQTATGVRASVRELAQSDRYLFVGFDPQLLRDGVNEVAPRQRQKRRVAGVEPDDLEAMFRGSMLAAEGPDATDLLTLTSYLAGPGVREVLVVQDRETGRSFLFPTRPGTDEGVLIDPADEQARMEAWVAGLMRDMGGLQAVLDAVWTFLDLETLGAARPDVAGVAGQNPWHRRLWLRFLWGWWRTKSRVRRLLRHRP